MGTISRSDRFGGAAANRPRKPGLGIWALLLLWLAGCEGPQQAHLADDAVLAQVHQRAITLAAYRNYVDKVPQSLRQEYDAQRFLKAMIDEELLLGEARQRQLDRRPEVLAGVRQEGRRLALAQLYQREGIERPQVTDEELQIYFADSPYSRKVRFSLLMVKNEAQIAPILAQLEQGADFTKLSMQHSQDVRILERGADMGYHRWGETMPSHQALTEKAFNMEVGQLAGPLKVADGYFLIKLTDIHPVSFDEERQTIEKLVLQERLARRLAEYYSGLVQHYQAEVRPAALKALAGTSAGAKTDTAVVYQGGWLSLERAGGLLAGNRQRPGADHSLEKSLMQQVCRQVLVPLEIERFKLLDEPEVRQGIERVGRQLTIRQLQQELAGQTPPNKTALKLYYEDNKERYQQAAQVSVRRRPVADAEAGRRLVEALRAGGSGSDLTEGFVDITYGSAAMEGESPFSRALRAEVGSFHGPFSTDQGYVVVQVTGREEARTPELAEVEEQVAADMDRARQGQSLQSLIDELRQRHEGAITINQETMKELTLLSYQEQGDE